METELQRQIGRSRYEHGKLLGRTLARDDDMQQVSPHQMLALHATDVHRAM
jgi:hypothetical protein